jgi:hypothetical protein
VSTLNEEPIRNELDLTEGESALIAGAETGVTAQINKTRVYADIYITKNLRSAINDLIKSNERLSNSNDRYARAMNWLTLGLLLVAVLQVTVAVFWNLWLRSLSLSIEGCRWMVSICAKRDLLRGTGLILKTNES